MKDMISKVKVDGIVTIIACFLITFVAFIRPVDAAYFKYADFDFDEFAKQKQNYWSQTCARNQNDVDRLNCVEQTIARQRQYYTRLYALLAKYEAAGLFINDNIIIMTSFFELDPDLFTDEGDYYQSLMGTDFKSYNVDANEDMKTYNIKQDDNNIDVYANETDTLKLLLKAMVSYAYTCYGSYGKPETHKNQDGTEALICPKGGALIAGSNLCLTKADSGYMGFWEYLLAKTQNPIFSFFGLKSDKHKDCDKLAGNYPNGIKFEPSNGEVVAVEKYWEFLETSTYFDRKPHLKYRYVKLVNSLKIKDITELSDQQLEENEAQLILIRRGIVDDIKALLDNYGDTNFYSVYTETAEDAFWWPVGSADITTDGTGIPFAMGDPVSTTITSGFRTLSRPDHNGVDLVGNGTTAGAYNIIASRSGIVTKIYDSCTQGDQTCGKGYGNYIIITHADGMATLYAHLHEGTIGVTENQSVRRGQVIAKMGNTGHSTGTHLHFEVHVGDQKVDPLIYINPKEPRKTGGSSVLTPEGFNMLRCFEGAGPDDGGNNFRVYDDKCGYQNRDCGGNLTVGMGLNIHAHPDRFKKRGVDADAIINERKVGFLISKKICDEIRDEILEDFAEDVISKLAKANITLTKQQFDALMSRRYHYGNINGFTDAYNQYGNTQALYDNWWRGTNSTRREREWNLFHNNIYWTC